MMLSHFTGSFCHTHNMQKYSKIFGLSESIKTFFSKIRTRDPIRIELDHQWLKDCNFWCVTFMKAEKFHQCSMSHEESNSIVGL